MIVLVTAPIIYCFRSDQTTDGQLYSGTMAQYSGLDGLIYRNGLRTDQFNARQLNCKSSHQLSSFADMNHQYHKFT